MGVYVGCASISMPPVETTVSFFSVGTTDGASSSTIEVLALGNELLWGDSAVLERPGVGMVGESMRS